jgi:60 kDa SS-A/Ro ribonucleoprotein
MTATEFSIADQNDPGMLDVVGFDTGSPNVIASFVRGAPIEAVEEDD